MTVKIKIVLLFKLVVTSLIWILHPIDLSNFRKSFVPQSLYILVNHFNPAMSILTKARYQVLAYFCLSALTLHSLDNLSPSFIVFWLKKKPSVCSRCTLASTHCQGNYIKRSSALAGAIIVDVSRQTIVVGLNCVAKKLQTDNSLFNRPKPFIILA